MTYENIQESIYASFSIVDVSNRTVPLYLFNGEVPRGVDNVLSGACEDGHLVVPHLWRVLQGGSDLQVETIGVIWERERGRED